MPPVGVATDSGATGEQPTTQERIESFLLAQESPEPEEEGKKNQGPSDEESRADDERPEDEGEAEEESPEESEGEEESDQEDADEEDDDSEESEADDEEEETLGVEELAHYLGIDEGQLEVDENGELFIKTKVDGEEGRAKLNDLVKSYQLEGHLNKKNMEVAEERKRLEELRTQHEQQAQQKLQQLDDTLQIAWRELGKEFENVDWQSLEPGERADLKQQFEERKQQLRRAYSQVEQARQEQANKQLESYREMIEKEVEKLPTLIPEWADDKVKEAERPKVIEYAKSIGFSDDEVKRIADARAVAVLRKAMKYDKLQQSKPSVTKKVRKAPKTARPGAGKTKGDQERANVRRLRSNVRKRGDAQSVHDYLLGSGKV